MIGTVYAFTMFKPSTSHLNNINVRLFGFHFWNWFGPRLFFLFLGYGFAVLCGLIPKLWLPFTALLGAKLLSFWVIFHHNLVKKHMVFQNEYLEHVGILDTQHGPESVVPDTQIFQPCPNERMWISALTTQELKNLDGAWKTFLSDMVPRIIGCKCMVIAWMSESFPFEAEPVSIFLRLIPRKS